jgi:hypothetical protein
MSVGFIFLAAVFISVSYKRKERTNNDDNDDKCNYAICGDKPITEYLLEGENMSTEDLNHFYETPFDTMGAHETINNEDIPDTINNEDIPDTIQFLGTKNDITIMPYLDIKSIEEDHKPNLPLYDNASKHISPFYDNAGIHNAPANI